MFNLTFFIASIPTLYFINLVIFEYFENFEGLLHFVEIFNVDLLISIFMFSNE